MGSETLEPPFEPQGGLPFDLPEGLLARPPIRPLYRLGLILVAITMILLPLVYLALVGGFGCAVYWYATHFSKWLNLADAGYGGWWILEILYFVPIFTGCVLFIFMIKPLFAPSVKTHEGFSLESADAPRLFAFLGWICRSLDAPIPSRVEVDCSVNASAHFRSGFGSLWGNDVVLTIGLPLAAGMNVSQLAGVIAHEYGHFAQGAGMRANFIIERINLWFVRVVYERDAWDMWLVETSEDSDEAPRTALLFYLLRFAVWLGRRPAWLLFVLGHFISSFMSRQMEFDADCYEIRMSGSECFAATSLRMQQLNVGSAISYKQAGLKWKKEKKLFDQIPDFIVSRANELPADTQARVYSETARRKTGYFDSHPSTAERVARAREAGDPGILHVAEPAKILFADFTGLSRRASEHYYRAVLGPEFKPEWLQATEQVTSRAEYDYTADRQRISAYCFGVCSNLRPVILPESLPLVYRSQENLGSELRACRDRIQAAAVDGQSALAGFHHADARCLQLRQLGALIQSGFAVDPAQYNVPDGDVDAAQAQALQELQSTDSALKPFEEIARARLVAGIQLLRLATFAATFPEAQTLQQHIKNMIFAQARLASCLPEIFELRLKCFTLDAIFRHRREHGAGDNLTQTLDKLSSEIREHIKNLQKQTGQIRYPFDHAVEDAFVSHFARNKDYYADPSEAALREGACQVERLLALEERILANIIEVCERVETHAGV